ncbi:MAG: hypothetical protein OEV64_13505, partial [Desulfobulbaceae bacterium]|nr:hypothetical protein [Desulfobulbaceae bacterium]
ATETHFEGKKQTHWTCQLVANYNLEKVNMIRNDTEKIFSHYQIEAPEYIDPKSTPPDVVIVQPEEVKKMIDELRKLAENKKLKKYEIDAIAAASRDNNDDELLRIYNQIKAREKGKSADDLVEKLT